MAPQLKVKVIRRPVLKLKVLPRFPSSVTVESPLTLDRTGGNYDFSIDVDALATSLNPIITIPASHVTNDSSATGSTGKDVFNTVAQIFNVKAYGALGNGSHADDAAINLALTAIRAAGGGTLWFPYSALGYWVTSAIDIRATSNLLIDGDPGTVIKCSSAFNASDNYLKSSIISGLNFTGTATSTGYAYRNIEVSKNITIDGTNQNVASSPSGGFGYNMAGLETMNIDDVRFYGRIVGCYGNGVCIGNQNPAQTAPSISSTTINVAGTGYAVGNLVDLNGGTAFTKARYQVASVNGSGGVTGVTLVSSGVYITLPVGNVSTTAISGTGINLAMSVTSATVANGIRNPVIEGEIIDTCRGLLPSYASIGEPGGVAGSGIQIGAATNIQVNARFTRIGGPAIDLFNCDTGTCHVDVESVGSTAIGSAQARGIVRSDFGLKRVFISGRAPALELRGNMSSGLSYVFNGGVATSGPIGCSFDLHLDGSIATDSYTPGVMIMGGSIAGTVGNAVGNTGNIFVGNSNAIGVELYDVVESDLNFIVHEPGQAAGKYIALKMFAQVNQAGGGCLNNRLSLVSRDSRALMINNFSDDATGLQAGNILHLGPVAATSGLSINLPDGSYVIGSPGTVSATVNRPAVRDANGILYAVNFIGFLANTATAAGTTTLTIGSAATQRFTGVTTQTCVLPVVSTINQGHIFWFENDSTGAVTINSSGGNLVLTLQAGGTARIEYNGTAGTAAASWDVRSFARNDAAQTFTGVQTFTSTIGGNISGNAATATTATTAGAVPLSGITGAGTGVLAALAINVGSAGAPVLFNGAGGTPSSVTLTNAGGTAASLTAGNATLAASATKLATARNIDGQAFDGTAAITVVAPGTHAASTKATPVDADELPLVDSASSNVLAKLTWANLKATIKTYYDAVTSTLTNKTFDSAGTGNVMKVSGVTVSAGQFPGETTTGSATAGNIGEYLETTLAIGSALSTVSATPKTIVSRSLTAGDWDVSGVLYFAPANTTSVTNMQGSISLVDNTLDVSNGRFIAVPMGTIIGTGSASYAVAFPPCRISIASTTTVYLVQDAVYTVSTLTAYGIIRARRAR